MLFTSSNGNQPAPSVESGASAKDRYVKLSARRTAFLDRARRYAQVTIPSLLPPAGFTQTQRLPETWTGFGAKLVTALSSRLLMAYLPSGMPFFKFQIPPEVLLEAGEQAQNETQERGLALSETTVMREIERRRWRAPTYAALQHLIITGNVMEQTMPDNSIRVFRLDQYVVVRNPLGEMIEFIVEESLAPAGLPPNLQAMLGGQAPVQQNQVLPLYTWGRLINGVWLIHQEFMGREVPKSRGTFRVNPFRAIRWLAIIGEDYGRSKVEEHYGDLRAVEGLSKSGVEGAAMASRNITTIRPNAAGGLNLRRRMTKADNGDVIIANPEDIDMLQFQNTNGMKITVEFLKEVKQELASAFLMNSSVQRKGERVTAFELRKMIEEIEQVLGGVFSALQEELQEGRLERLLLQMKAQQKLPDWPEGLVEASILTGVEALGREKDVERVSTVLQALQALPPEVLDFVDMPILLTKFFNGLGLPDAVVSTEEVERRRALRAQQEALARATPEDAAAVAQAAGQEVPQQEEAA